MAAVCDVIVRQSILESMGEALKTVGIGLLIGEENGQSMSVWSCTRSSERVEEDAIKVNNILPGGLNVLGLYRLADSSSAQNGDFSEDPIRPTVEALMKFLKTDRFVVFNYASQHPHSSTMLLFMSSSSGHDLDTSNNVQWTAVVDNDGGCFLDGHVRFRLKTQVPLRFKFEPKSDKLIRMIKTEVEELCKVINSPLTVFHIKNSSILFFKEQSTTKSEEQPLLTEEGINNDGMENGDRSPSPPILQRYQQVYGPDETCANLYKYMETNDVEMSFFVGKATSQKKKKETVLSGLQKSAIPLDMFMSISGDTKTKQTPSCAPLIHQRQDDFRQVCLPLQLDVLTIVSNSYPLSQLAQTLATAVCRQIQAAECCITEHRQGSNFSLPKFHHIELPGSTLFVSITYPEEIDENLLEYQRKNLHHLFRLSLNSPIFRKGNTVVFEEDIVALGGYLINPHIGLSSGVKGGTPHLVQGRYAYHHYMQDNFDDNKWGCAYRSLQTIVSWFRFQGYTDVPVPSHRVIQQALVDIEDKPASFVGSRQWIGSFEVGYCLDHLLGVQCRVMNVSSGAELSSRGRELSMHFDVQGTPVMIGGGVLAHTILGVDYNELTGDIKFLILDPHYTGGEDLKYIQDSGWCGWKGPNFWDKNAHYNLCLPQRPITV